MSVYRERLWPTLWVFLACVLIVPATMAVFLPINSALGIILAIAFYAAVVVLLIATSPIVEVSDAGFRAGRALLPLRFIGSASAHRGQDAVAERGLRLDARAWLLLRGWVHPVVRVTVDDPDDPVPYWVVSTRHPDAVVRAIADLKQAPSVE